MVSAITGSSVRHGRNAHLRRGRGLRYPRSTLSRVAKPWEFALADDFEERFALIRGLLHSIAHVRKVLRQHAALERSTADAKAALQAARDLSLSGDMTDDSWE
jgi:hypothetical protein